VKIDRRRGLTSAHGARGDVVVIDVLRACTTAAFAFGAGASEIVLVSTPTEAFELKQRFPRAKLVGEVGGKPIAGFDFGNSPAAIVRANLKGRTLILRSSSGTQGALRATQAERIWLGSLPVAGVTSEILRSKSQLVTLLAMGAPDGAEGPEDDACSDLMQALLEGRAPDLESIARQIRASPAAALAMDPKIDWIVPEDLECALDYDFFGFAILVQREGDLLIARQCEPA
jgi:2-phosphosulfolactate phosphatase